MPRAAQRGAVQLRLIADDGYEGPEAAAAAGGVAPPLPCPDAGSPDLDQAQRTCPSVRPRGRAARLATSVLLLPRGGLGGEPVRV